MIYDRNINPNLLQEELGTEIGLSTKNLETLSRWSMRAEFYLPDDPAIDAIVQAHDHTQKTAQQLQIELEESIYAAIELDTKQMLIGNAHFISLRKMVIAMYTLAVMSIVNGLHPLTTLAQIRAVLNGPTADLYDPTRQLWTNFCRTLWMRHPHLFTTVTQYEDVETEVVNMINTSTDPEFAGLCFQNLQMNATAHAVQMMLPSMAKLIAPELMVI